MLAIERIQMVWVFLLMFFPGIALGQVSQLINYRGVLIDLSTGSPVPDDRYSITFSIYNVASGDSAIWTEILMKEIQ